MSKKITSDDELTIANRALALQNKEKEERADELIIANKELAFQNHEKEKRAGELIIANKELAFQKDEKEKRADELIIANKELAFQTKEKGKRAQELIIADKELAFQKGEKGKRAEELIIANKELAFQTKEKGKRAQELIIANKELDFQNEEKGKRADELISYKHFFYNTMDLACFASLDGYFEELNASFTKALGYTTKELTERKFLDFIHPDDIGSTLKELEKLASGIETLNFNNRYKTKSGPYIHIEWNSVFNQETKKIYATGRDITEKIIAVKELAYQSEEKEKRAGELIIANKELAFQNEEKGKRAEELIVANKELAFQNEEKGKRAEELIVANKELAFQNEEKGKRAEELIVANKELAFQNEEKGKRAEELFIANTELKKAEAEIRKFNEELEQKVAERTVQLEAANKEIGSFSYSVSHDLRAPIRAINGYAKILEEDYVEKLDLDGKSALDAIIHNSKKMGQLIDDLLAFSKLGRKEVSVSEINMAALVNSIKEELAFEDTVNLAEFNIKTMLPAQGDQSLIKQVWINLISNAIKYSKYKPKTFIEIGSYKKDNLVVYYVKDNGAGFDMKYYDKLFGVFQRLHSQDEFEGTGIGLAIVQKIVSRHKGTVWAESKLTEGTCFYFSLPNINT